MATEGQELGPFTPVPRRAGLGRDPASAAPPQLESLRVAGSLERTRKHGQYQWTLTPRGRRRLAAARRAGRVGELPDSPQHRRWRHAREEAERRIDDFRTLIYQTLDAAEAIAEPADGPGSETATRVQRVRLRFKTRP